MSSVYIRYATWLASVPIAVGLSACGLPGYSGHDNPNIHLEAGPGSIGNRPFGITSITAARRLAVIGTKRSDADSAGYVICSEGPPTAAENIASKFGASVAVAVPTGSTVGGDLVRQVSTGNLLLRTTTQGLDYFDKVENAACKMYLNGALTKTEYSQMIEAAIWNSARLIELELQAGFAQHSFSALPIVVPESDRAEAAKELYKNAFQKIVLKGEDGQDKK